MASRSGLSRDVILLATRVICGRDLDGLYGLRKIRGPANVLNGKERLMTYQMTPKSANVVAQYFQVR